MVVYLTFNDPPSGIYKSQVIDRLDRIRQSGNAIQLIAFFTHPDFQHKKKEVLEWDSTAIVLKQLPGLRYWWVNLLKLIPIAFQLKPIKIIGRSIYATNLGLLLKNLHLVNSIIYDGRGAVSAECREFKMVPASWLGEIERLEERSIKQSDFQISVSNALIKHWRSKFGYHADTNQVIPCVFGSAFENIQLENDFITKSRRELCFSPEDVVVAYSGSLAGWQFREGLEIHLADWLSAASNHKLLFLSKRHPIIEYLSSKFPNQFMQKYVSPEDVAKYLVVADYGLLVRADYVTNRVASPVKFAEYLACGLKVIISSGIGDFSKFVDAYDCGFVWDGPSNFPDLQALNLVEKVKNRELAIRFFSGKSSSLTNQFEKIAMD